MLTDRLRQALERLNLNATSDAIDTAIQELTQSRKVMTPIEANREIYNLLKDGVKVTTTDPKTQEETVSAIKVVDWENPKITTFSQRHILDHWRHVHQTTRPYLLRQRHSLSLNGVQAD